MVRSLVRFFFRDKHLEIFAIFSNLHIFYRGPPRVAIKPFQGVIRPWMQGVLDTGTRLAHTLKIGGIEIELDPHVVD